jgi:hemoglobin/transferrin/lactoferrin receptor protein
LVLVLMAGSAAWSADVAGRVVSAENGEPLEAVTVAVDGQPIVTQTDSDGRFELNGITEPVSLTVSHVGYATELAFAVTVGGDNRIALQPSISVLNTVVVTANRYEKAAYKVTQPITAVGSREIETKGHAIVSDVIRDFPGVDMNDAGPFRARPVIRGVLGTRVLVLVDGERLNDQRDVTDFAGVSMSLVDVNEIERVEVVNGPSSVLYGSDAMGGVINIITKKNRFDGRTRLTASYNGRFSTADEQHSNRVDLGFESEKFALSGGFQYREALEDYRPPDGYNTKGRYKVFSDEFYEQLNADKGTSYDGDRLANSQARVANYDFRGAYKINDRHRLDANLDVFRGDDIGYPGVPNDSTPFFFFYPRHDRTGFSLSYTGRAISNRLARIEAKVYYQEIKKDFFTDFLGNIPPIPLGPPGSPSLNLISNLNRTEVKKYGVTFQEIYDVGALSQLTFGVDAVREDIDGGTVEITRLDFPFPGPPPVYDTSEGASVPQNTWHSLGVYASGEHSFGRVQAIGGLRYDNFWVGTDETEGYEDSDDIPLAVDDDHYSRVNGSLGLVYNLTESVNLVGKFGTAYRVPNVVERFFYGSASGRQTRPNPEIKPERTASFDAGVKAVHDRWNYSLIGFYSDYADFTKLRMFGMENGQPLWRYENLDEVTIWGAEGVVDATFENGAYGSLGVSWQRGNIDSENQPLFVSPLKTTLTVGYRHEQSGAFGDVRFRRVEEQDRVPEDATLDDIATEGFTVVSATVGIQLFENVRFALTGNNLFDEVYSEPFNGRNVDNPLPEPGRNFVFTLSAGI